MILVNTPKGALQWDAMRTLLLLLTLLPLVVAGCAGGAKAKVPTKPMGSGAPEFGSTAEYSTVAGFIVGRWSPVEGKLDAEFAKQLGVESLSDPNKVEVIIGQWWEFAPDGTFFYSQDGVKWKINGHWTASGNGVRLTYETQNSKTIAQAKADLRKNAETGVAAAIAVEMKMERLFDTLEVMTYFELHEDKKRLHFKTEGASPGGLEAMLAAHSTLMRMGYEKE